MAALSFLNSRSILNLSSSILPDASTLKSMQEFTVNLQSLEKDIESIDVVPFVEYQDKAQNEISNMLTISDNLQQPELKLLLHQLSNDAQKLIPLKSDPTANNEYNITIISIYSNIQKIKVLSNQIIVSINAKLLANVVKQDQITIVHYIHLGILVCLAAFLAFAMSISLQKSILKPLKQLEKQTEQLGAGKFDQAIEIDSQDEFGKLAKTLNQMAQQLKSSQQKIVDDNQHLEQIVAEKTLALNQKLSELKRMNEFMVGREVRMAEMKKQMQELTNHS
jgi:methyl-accepting chemotaxis protein